MNEQARKERLVEAGRATRYVKGKGSGNPGGRPPLVRNLPLRERLLAQAPDTLDRLEDVAKLAAKQAAKAEGGEQAKLLGVALAANRELLAYQLGKPWEGDLDSLPNTGRRKSRVKAAPASTMPALAATATAALASAAPTVQAQTHQADKHHYVNSGGEEQGAGSSRPSSAGPPPLTAYVEDIEVI